MKISEVIHQLESEEVVNPVINDLIKETLHYLSSLCKTNGQWDLTLIDELEEEQTYTPTELIMLINDITLSFAQNAVVPIIEYDTDNERNVVLPAIKTKSRRIDINQLPSFEPPLICILQQVISINEAKRVDDQLLVNISRLLQCYLANCANLQFSVLWDEEYDRSITNPYTDDRLEEWALGDKFIHERNFIRDQYKSLYDKIPNASLDEALNYIMAVNRNDYPTDNNANQITKITMKKLAEYFYEDSFTS
jgi:hypothetical protein